MTGILCSCSESKKWNRKYGISFNKVRKENKIPILPKNWHLENSYFTNGNISWAPIVTTNHGFVSKSIEIQNNVINTESDTYYSGKLVVITDPDHGGTKEPEELIVRYFYDKTEKLIYKTMIFTNHGNGSRKSFDEARKILKKWGITIQTPVLSPQKTKPYCTPR